MLLPEIKSDRQGKWFSGVDSIRFVLALIVVLRHHEDPYVNLFKNSSSTLLHYTGYFLANAFDGVSAVIAFFIISGFVIHYPNKTGIKNLKTFWIRRYVRILIPLTVILIIGSLFGHPEKTVVWSLYCELIYYTLYPVLFKIKISWKNKFFIAYGLSALVIGLLAYHDIIALLKRTDVNYQGYYWQFGIYFTWIVGLPCWLLGVLIAEYIDGLKQVKFSTVVAYRVIIYCLSCFFCFGKFHLHLSYILSMNIFALLLYKWIQSEIVYFKNAKPNETLEKMGKFSYSLYLCHPLLYTILALFMGNTLITYPICILLVVLISYCFYRVVEKPSHMIAHKINNRYNPSV